MYGFPTRNCRDVACNVYDEEATNSAVIFINFPFLRIVLYVSSNTGQGILVPNDVVKETRLPGEIGIPIHPRQTGDGPF